MVFTSSEDKIMYCFSVLFVLLNLHKKYSIISKIDPKTFGEFGKSLFKYKYIMLLCYIAVCMHVTYNV